MKPSEVEQTFQEFNLEIFLKSQTNQLKKSSMIKP